MVQGFQEWLIKQNIIGLALAVVVGTALTKVVSAIVADVIMPVVGLILPGGNWREFAVALGGPAPEGQEQNALRLGDLLGSFVDFLIIAIVVYLLIRAFVKTPPPPETRECPRCMEQIPRPARRCKFCTSELEPGTAAAPAR